MSRWIRTAQASYRVNIQKPMYATSSTAKRAWEHKLPPCTTFVSTSGLWNKRANTLLQETLHLGKTKYCQN